jgi:hypothetical protein
MVACHRDCSGHPVVVVVCQWLCGAYSTYMWWRWHVKGCQGLYGSGGMLLVLKWHASGCAVHICGSCEIPRAVVASPWLWCHACVCAVHVYGGGGIPRTVTSQWL